MKQNLVKFQYTEVIKLNLIFLTDKHQRLFYLKKRKSFEKGLRFFLQILAKKGLGLVIFSKDGRVNADIHFFCLTGNASKYI